MKLNLDPALKRESERCLKILASTVDELADLLSTIGIGEEMEKIKRNPHSQEDNGNGHPRNLDGSLDRRFRNNHTDTGKTPGKVLHPETDGRLKSNREELVENK